MENNDLLRVFIGFDPRQAISYNVLQYSIVTQSSRPVQISPLIIEQLPIARRGLTPFTYSRYLIPWLCNYQGWALFMDADMLLNDDIAKLFALADEQYDVMVVKLEERFEWPSLMLFNCAKCTTLTPEFVEDTANSCANFAWTTADRIGELPSEWNHTVGYSPKREGMSLIHYTQGVPIFPEIQGCEYSTEWNNLCADMISFGEWQDIMGQSVHATQVDGAVIPKLRIKELMEEAMKLKDVIQSDLDKGNQKG